MIWALLPLMLLGWGIVAFTTHSAFQAKKLDDQFGFPASLACFSSFLFCGPFCIAIWYALLLRMIFLSHRR